jgi:rhodanese-related sulfurtransferase
MTHQAALKVIEGGPVSAPTPNNELWPIEVDVATVRRWVAAGEAVLVDVREAVEFEAERIPGTLLMPLSLFNGQRFPRLPGVKLVLHCAVGKRSAAAGKQLLQSGYPQVYNMTGGINAWKAAGYPTET